MDQLGVELTLGFAGLGAALIMVRPMRPAAAGLSFFFSVYAGLSGLAAAEELQGSTADFVRVLAPLTQLGIVASEPSAEEAELLSAFRLAAQLTAAAGLVAVLGALIGERVMRARASHARGTVLGRDAERLGRTFVLIGFVGLALALVRFVFVGMGEATLFASVKSFWTGGSYLLLLAHLAVPGFALWFSALASERRRPKDWRLPAGALLVFLLAITPTGQRTFVLEAALAATAVVVVFYRPRPKQVFRGAVAVVVLLGVTQAIRNEVREADTVTLTGTLARLAPAELPSLYRSQLASFRWTVEAVRYQEELRFPKQLEALATKPIPRQLYPDKPAGFAEQFTAQLYPDAAASDVHFATPPTAEWWTRFGAAGVVVSHLLLGLALGGAAQLSRLRSPRVLLPIFVVAIAWTGFVFLRGDTANAAVAASAWLLPLAAFTVLLQRSSRRCVNRVVVDALQTSPELSGVGRQVEAIGQDLRSYALSADLVVRCPRDVEGDLRASFPAGTEFDCPIASSRPRWRRILYQQLVAPIRDRASTMVLAAGDQASLWGTSRLALVVHDVRRLTEPSTSSVGERLFYRILQPASIRRADVLLVVSDFSRREVARATGRSSRCIVVQHHPGPRVEAPCRPRAALEPSHLLVVGVLRPYKGTADVIDALKLIAGPHPPRVVFIGSDFDGYRARLEERADRLGVSDRIEFLGWVSDTQLDQLRRSALASVCPSHYEGYGLAVAESLAYGLPTIASRLPAHVEVAADAARWFEPGDVEGLSDAIGEIANRPQLHEDHARRALERSRVLQSASPSWSEAVALARGAATAESVPPPTASSRRADSSPTSTPHGAPGPAAGTAGPVV